MCRISGNEEEDHLTMSLCVSDKRSPTRKRQIHSKPSDDQMDHLSQNKQTTIFRLLTGHSHLCSQLHHLRLLNTPDFVYKTAPIYSEHKLLSYSGKEHPKAPMALCSDDAGKAEDEGRQANTKTGTQFSEQREFY